MHSRLLRSGKVSVVELLAVDQEVSPSVFGYAFEITNRYLTSCSVLEKINGILFQPVLI